MPPLRLLLVLDNLSGHHTPSFVMWLCEHGIMPLYTPLGGSWLTRKAGMLIPCQKGQGRDKRPISTLVGVSTGLAPDFNFIDVAAPYARKFMGLDTEAIGRAIQQLLRQFVETMNTLLKMPRTIERILVKLEAGQFVINLGGISASVQRLSADAKSVTPLVSKAPSIHDCS
jgi:predicted unusual protein kinase regulating ubiquinone biosynthesis (AarF/ABC1/UbiB family)